MRMKLQHAPYIAKHIATDLSLSSYITMNSTLSNVAFIAEEILRDNLKLELEIESKTRDLIEQNQDEIDVNSMDEKQLFKMIKKQIAKEKNFNLDHHERHAEIAHDILTECILEEFIKCNVNDNLVKNLIIDSINKFSSLQESARDNVFAKMKNLKRKLIPGSDEYELMFNRMYEEELKKTGLL